MGAVILDTETTGWNPNVHRVIEIAIMDYETGVVLIDTRVDPMCEIPLDITQLTGISAKDLEQAPTFPTIAQEVAAVLANADAVLGYNPWFDRGMIAAEFRRCNLTVRWPVLICAKRLWDIHEPKEKRDLQNAFKRFVDPIGYEGRHGALADTRACRDVLQKQISMFGLTEKAWAEYDPEQTIWWGSSNHVIWQDDKLVLNFGKYKGISVIAIDTGFWRWVSRQDFPAHVLQLADYMVYVAKKDTTAADVAAWARTKEQ